MPTHYSHNEKRLEQSLIASLKAGKKPTIRKFFKSAEKILERFGYKPGEIFIPDPALSDMENIVARRRFNARKFYKGGRVKVGRYMSRGDRVSEYDVKTLSLAKKKILNKMRWK